MSTSLKSFRLSALGRFSSWAFLRSAVPFIALAGCAAEITDTPLYETDACRRVSLVDTKTGALVVGAEDIAVDLSRRVLYVSAYDRRAAETAARRKAFSIPQGGVYRVSLSDLTGATDNKMHRLIAAEPLIEPDAVAGGLRPHGLDFDEQSGEIAFINRGYQKINDRWRMTPRVERVGVMGEMFVGNHGAAHCAANDLLAENESHLVSIDHGECGWSAGFEDVFGLAKSGLITDAGEGAFSAVKFANGVARTPSGAVAVAGTRDKAILFLDEADNDPGRQMTLSKRVEVPGGPDNLTVTAQGELIAAVHPSLITLALDRKLNVGRAPSRVVKLLPDGQSVQTLFDDPIGGAFSAATVGVEIDAVKGPDWVKKSLVVGSVMDEGLLICSRTEAMPNKASMNMQKTALGTTR